MKLTTSFNPRDFIAQYWQKKPVVIRNAFDDFEDPIDENELAGLALESDIDSRLIALSEDQWSVQHGPIDDYQHLGQSIWTLLVQGVNLYSETVGALLSEFSFIPDWRKDDVMVSFSTANAGVGPHIDQYDVFIIQGKGSRRWQVGPIGEYREHCPHPDLRQINGFEPIIDEVLNPGDMIYIPPGYPHNGVALEPCLNYSIGFRAPNQQELISAYADYLYDSDIGHLRYSDPDLEVRDNAKLITAEEIEKFRALVTKAVEAPDFDQWLTSFLSKNRYLEEQELDMSDQMDMHAIQVAIEQGQKFAPSPDASPVVHCAKELDQSVWVLSLGEGHFTFADSDGEKLFHLLNSRQWPSEIPVTKQNSLFFNQLLSTLVNTGYWYPVD